MRRSHQQLAVSRAGALRTAVMVVAALGAATTIVPGVTATGATANPVPGEVLLAGPTGSRGGVAVVDPAAPPDPATIAPLDTYGRDPQLRITSADPDGAWASWQVEATSVTDPAADRVSLGSGVAEVPIETVDLIAPAPGDWLVTASLTGGESTPSGTWAWHLVIPDRSLPDIIPAPDLVLFGGGETQITERGSGCYLGMCGDIGGLPPDATLPAVRLDRADEPVALTLSDGGGMAAVRAAVTPIGVEETTQAVLLDADLDPAATVVMVPPPPGPGRWRLELLVRFADGRGDQAAYARVIAP
jgi:hypothetical protein